MRIKPYADRPLRFTVQLVTDLLVLVWVVVWIQVGRFVHDAVTSVSTVGYTLESGATGIADNLTEAGRDAGGVPLVGDKLSTPLTSAGDAASSVAGAGQDLGDSITTLGTVLGLVVALAPILSVVAVWAALRWRFARRAGATALLATSPGGQHLLALRALAGRPLHELVAVSDDPVAAWDAEDPDVTRALADLETRRWGVRLRGPALAS
ncbi:MAG: hypothetical protein GXX79_02815 [Actinomycetales bacterium]|nr:hypothetical protein [Actinomycetales bacterium]